MGKNAAKKRRSNRATTKINRTLKNYGKHFHRKLTFSTDEIRAAWNPRMSQRANLHAMGLESDANAAIVKRGSRTSAIPAPTPEREAATLVFMAIPPSDPVALSRGDLGYRNPRRRPMSEVDQVYLKALIDAHGEDYTAMQRDAHRNNLQHGETKLKGLCARFMLLDEEQRVV